MSDLSPKREKILRDACKGSDRDCFPNEPLLREALAALDACRKERDALEAEASEHESRANRWMNGCEVARERAEKAEKERDEARETIKRLNRRAQELESAITNHGKATDPGALITAAVQRKPGRPLGRMAANYKAIELEGEVAKLREHIKLLRESAKPAVRMFWAIAGATAGNTTLKDRCQALSAALAATEDEK